MNGRASPEFFYGQYPPRPSKKVRTAVGRQILPTGSNRAQKASSGVTIKQEPTDQSFFDLAASLANRSAFSRSKFLRCAICSFSYSVSGLSDGRNMLLASFSRLLMT